MVKKMKGKIDKKITLLPAIFAKKLATWLVILLCISLIFTVIPMVKIVSASSVTWYVATTGSDAAAGDISHPFKTIQHAVDVAQAGHTIYVRGGTYKQAITMKHSGTAGNPITIAGAAGETAIIDGTGINYWAGLVYLNGKDYLTFTNLKIQNSATHGIYTGWESGTNPSTDITVTNCDFYHIFNYAILFYAQNKAYPCYRMKVTHCTFDDIEYAFHNPGSTQECVGFGGCIDSEFAYNKMTHIHKIGFDFGTCKNCIAHHNDIDVTGMSTEAYGIYVIAGHTAGYECTDISIYDNYVHGNRQCIGIGNEKVIGTTSKRITIVNNLIVPTGSYAGISMFNMVSGCYFQDIRILHNTIYAPDGARCIFMHDIATSEISGLYIANNICSGSRKDLMNTINPTVITNNLFYSPSGATNYGTNYQNGNPNFNTPFTDFHLTTSSLLAIGKASSTYTSSTYGTTTDFDGKTRTSAYDIGAYEYDGEIVENSDSPSPSDSASPAPTPPVISQVNIIHSHTDLIVAGHGWENVTCVVTDNDGISTVVLQLNNPNQSTTNVPMIKKIGSTTYYANLSLHQRGKYGYRIQATDANSNVALSPSYTFWLQPDWDIDNDGICNIRDLVKISSHYGETGFKGWIREDVDHNGVIQALDIAIVSSQYDRSWWS